MIYLNKVQKKKLLTPLKTDKMNNENQLFIWNGINLEELRQVMDKPSDDAVLSVFESGTKMQDFVADLKKMASNHDYIPDEIPRPMHDFVEKELAFEFTDEDIKYFKQTHEIWKKKGMKFIFILFFRALPYTYMAEKPANVLRMTKLLKTHAERRIFETAQFVFDVMDENWWTPEKKGILTALKIRIMHSAMRHVILQTRLNESETDIVTGVWNKKWGNPISQEDLIATNQVFSLEFFKGMEMLGEKLSDEEQKAWFHTFKIIGKIMGVQDALLCKEVSEAWTLQHKVYAHLFNDDTVSGIPLATALVETMDHFHMPQRLVLLLMKKMLADEQFPDCFTRMLGPSFGDKYPELFEVHETSEGKAAHEKRLKEHFHDDLKTHHNTLKQQKSNYKPEEPHKGWFEKIVDWFMNLFGVSKKEQHLIDIHIELLHNVLHHPDSGNPREILEEQLMIDSMNAMGGIMISVLSKHYRDGKNTGFRIPASLQDNWQLKG